MQRSQQRSNTQDHGGAGRAMCGAAGNCATADAITILVVDDDPLQLEIIDSTLGDAGMGTLLCSDPAEALAMAIAARPNLILLDVRMEGASGHQVCRQLKSNALCMDIPVIFLSGAGEPQDRLLGLEAGAVDYVAKPFYPPELLARIRLHLALAVRRDTAAGPPMVEAPAQPDFVDRARAILDADTLCHLSLAELAHRVGTNEKTLTRSFKSRLGKTVFSYLRQRRMEMSSRWLQQSAMPLAEIAFRCGFSSSANYITAFRQHFGMTPKRYRIEAGLACARELPAHEGASTTRTISAPAGPQEQ
jgi:DNA-binding response OmpR family regulator